MNVSFVCCSLGKAAFATAKQHSVTRIGNRMMHAYFFTRTTARSAFKVRARERSMDEPFDAAPFPNIPRAGMPCETGIISAVVQGISARSGADWGGRWRDSWAAQASVRLLQASVSFLFFSREPRFCLGIASFGRARLLKRPIKLTARRLFRRMLVSIHLPHG